MDTVEFFRKDLCNALIELRQNPDYAELKPLIRSGLRYIEKLEREVFKLQKQLSKKPNRFINRGDSP